MFNPVASQAVNFERVQSNKELRKMIKLESGLDVRRMDNFSLIAILAVFRLMKDQQIEQRIGLYSVATYFSIDLLQGLLMDINNNVDIRPVDFISTVGNTANFYLAKLFNITGPNIFIGTSEKAQEKLLSLAQCDLNNGLIDYALLVEWQDNEISYQCVAKLLQRT